MISTPIRKAGVRAALKRGEPVISNDDTSYAHNHAILVVGQTPKGFWIADPLVAEVYWRKDEQFFAASDEWIAVG